MRRARYGVAGIVVAMGLALTAQLGPPSRIATAQAQAAAAPGGPGALSHFDLARKDCLGTARNRTSKVWYTVAGGVLSDVYYPTVDNTNVETLQYVVTDGSIFYQVLWCPDWRYCDNRPERSYLLANSGCADCAGQPVPVTAGLALRKTTLKASAVG